MRAVTAEPRDVLVAGAGPAGAIAARQLALSGLSVTLVDGLASGISKIGETLPGAAIRLLKRLGLDAVVTPERVERGVSGRSVTCWPVGGALIAWNDAQMVAADAFNDPHGQGLRLDRAPFDAALRLAATSAGACFQCADVIGLERHAEGWNVDLDDGRVLQARWLVDATGRRARLARLIGQRRWRGAPLVALYRTGRPGMNGDLNRTIITTVAEGWIYAGRLADGRWTLGYHTTPQQAAALHAEPTRWNDLITESVCLADLLGEWSLDQGVRAHDARSAGLDRPVAERWIACGDAALAFDPIAGQGLFHAICTGMSVARIIRSSGDAALCARYSEELANIAAIYAARRRRLYGQVQCWRERQFWQIHRE